MIEVADETVGSSAAEGQRVAPEVPLEDDNAKGHHDDPDKRQCRLSACKTGVEKGDTGHHEQHHRRRDDDVRLVTRLVPLVQVLGSCGYPLLVRRSFVVDSIVRRRKRGSPESPPVTSFVPLNSAGAPIQEYDMLGDGSGSWPSRSG